MILIIENANKDLEKLVKAAAKLANANVRVHKEKPPKALKAALQELKDIESNPHLYKSYTNAGEMIQDCLK